MSSGVRTLGQIGPSKFCQSRNKGKILSNPVLLKFIYSEKAIKLCEIFTLLLSNVVPVKSKVKISQNFVAFSEYMNFKFNIGSHS